MVPLAAEVDLVQQRAGCGGVLEPRGAPDAPDAAGAGNQRHLHVLLHRHEAKVAVTWTVRPTPGRQTARGGLETLLIGGDEGLVGRGTDVGDGVAGYDPALWRLIAQRLQVFGFPGEQRDDRAFLEQAAGVSGADEIGEVGGGSGVEDRFRVGLGQRMHGDTGVDAAQWRPLPADELDIRALGEQERLEPLMADWPYS